MDVELALPVAATDSDLMAVNVTEIDDESRLVRAARSGSRAAFGRLYERYCRMVHAIVLARAPRTEAEDLVQDVFVLALKRLPSLREPNAFGGWLAMIARNRATDYLRTARDTTELQDNTLRQEAPSPETAVVLDALRSLPDAYKETLMMRLVEGMTGPEIALRTGLTPDSVRVNLHRGMKQLREKLGGIE